MPVFLDTIVDATRRRVAEARRTADLRALEREAAEHQPRGFRKRLLQVAARGPAVIAELKKASPSKGVIRGTMRVGIMAAQLQTAGAAALSVLTEEEFFQGSLDNLREASAATELPCLRKDFIVDEFQLIEARANRADAVLLIASVLEDAQMRDLHARARELGLDVLCEVHNEQELKRVLAMGAEIIGVNSRDLKTFHLDLEAPLRLGSMIPSGVLSIAESGIATGADLKALNHAGYEAFLVGESLMRADDPGEALTRLIAEAKSPPLGSIGVGAWKLGTKD